MADGMVSADMSPTPLGRARGAPSPGLHGGQPCSPFPTIAAVCCKRAGSDPPSLSLESPGTPTPFARAEDSRGHPIPLPSSPTLSDGTAGWGEIPEGYRAFEEIERLNRYRQIRWHCFGVGEFDHRVLADLAGMTPSSVFTELP